MNNKKEADKIPKIVDYNKVVSRVQEMIAPPTVGPGFDYQHYSEEVGAMIFREFGSRQDTGMTSTLILAEATAIGILVDSRQTGGIMPHQETLIRINIRRTISALQNTKNNGAEQ